MWSGYSALPGDTEMSPFSAGLSPGAVTTDLSGKFESGVNGQAVGYQVRDEYGLVQPQGALNLGRGGAYSFTVLLQASRLGFDLNGRRYTVIVLASDNAGNVGTKTGAVIVPHDQRR